MDRAAIIDALRAAVAAAPGVRAALDAILDRRERDRRLPATLTVDADARTVAALRAVFSARAVTTVAPTRARLSLRHVGTIALDELLYAALDRAPRDPRAARARRRDELSAALRALPTPRHLATRDFLDAERAAAAAATGDTWLLAERDGIDRAVAIIADVAVALDALLELQSPLRTANFSARILGDSKALAPGSERARRLGAALITHDPATQADVAIGLPASPAAAAATALELRGLLRDEVGVLVHVFGPLVYARAGAAAPFDHVARHAALGEPSPLSAVQLRDATLVDLPARRITLFENQAPFLDYLERADPHRELVIFARGQATWAVVMLLRLCAPARLPIRHAGDLDRSGVLILRSLARRTHLAIEPWCMDVATHRRFAASGRAIDAEERARLARQIAIDDPAAVGHDLLLELHRTGTWIEQEAFSHLLLSPAGDSL